MSTISTTLWMGSIPNYKLGALKWTIFLSSFVTFAVGAPYLCHQFGLAGVVFLPMHFAVILAAMTMGIRGGLLTALASPVISFALSGMPPVASLAPMTVELSIYAVVAGWLVHHKRLPLIGALIIAMIAGRMLSISLGIFGFGSTFSLAEKARILFVTGLPGIIAQLLLLPPATSKISKFLADGNK